LTVQDQIHAETEAALQNRVRFEKLIATILTQFLEMPADDTDGAVMFALQSIGTTIGADHAYIMLLEKDGVTIRKIHEWCAAGVQPVASALQDTQIDRFPWLFDRLKRFEPVSIATADKLPPEAAAEKTFFAANNIQSLVVVPVVYGGTLAGCLGFDSAQPHRLPHDVSPLLKIVGEMFVSTLERSRITHALHQSEENFRQVVNSISDHIYFYAVNKNDERTNLYISPNVADLTGYPIENFQNDWSFWPRIVIHPDDQAAAALQAKKLGQGQSSEMEYRLVRADGEIIWVRDSGRVEFSGDEMLVYGVVSDVTERKMAQQALADEKARLAQRVQERTAELSLANAELSRAARLKDEFLAAMSHELRTPLNAVLGMSEALQEQVYGPLNEEQREAVNRIEDSGRHLLSLINDILDLSRIEAGKMELQITPVDVDVIGQVSRHFIDREAHGKRIKVSVNVEPGIKLKADERRLKQILVNLLSNAVKFTPEGGQVGLDITNNPENDAVDFTVWDTGIGIAAEDAQRLFKPFVQLDSRLSRRYEGTGLGLTLVYRMVEMHQGGVRLESEVGRGSRFTVSLPREARSNQIQWDYPQTRKTMNKPDDTSSPLILLAEDNEANIATISDYLLAKGFNLTVARDGAEALERAKEDHPALILMDIQMPVMDGLEATRHVRSEAGLQDIPIIALTALAMPGDRERCMEAGATDYLSKPVSLKRLVEVIQKYLG